MVSIKRILCPVDFSEFSRHALERAIGIAASQNAAVTALHVVVDPRLGFAFSPEAAAIPPPGLTGGERARLVGELRDFAAGMRAAGIPVEIQVAEGRSAHEEIAAAANQLDADLIVIGTHGRTGFQRLVFGSVAEKVLRIAAPPVLTVGPPVQPRFAGLASFTRLLCAVDFSECSRAALRYARAIAEGSEARVAALNVLEWTPVAYDPLLGPLNDLAGYRMAAEADTRQRLESFVAECVPDTFEVETIVSSGKPHHEIVRTAGERAFDLIVLGIHGRNPVDRLLFGSTAEGVVRRAGCPVLSVRTYGTASAAAA